MQCTYIFTRVCARRATARVAPHTPGRPRRRTPDVRRARTPNPRLCSPPEGSNAPCSRDPDRVDAREPARLASPRAGRRAGRVRAWCSLLRVARTAGGLARGLAAQAAPTGTCCRASYACMMHACGSRPLRSSAAGPPRSLAAASPLGMLAPVPSAVPRAPAARASYDARKRAASTSRSWTRVIYCTHLFY
jgi:hypothetical protein